MQVGSTTPVAPFFLACRGLRALPKSFFFVYCFGLRPVIFQSFRTFRYESLHSSSSGKSRARVNINLTEDWASPELTNRCGVFAGDDNDDRPLSPRAFRFRP